MPIKIVAERKVSLKGFAEGWDSCYLKVRAVNEEERIELGALLKESEATDDPSPEAEMKRVQDLRGAVRDVLLGGVVMSTNEEGKTKSAPFYKEDPEATEEVIAALNVAWLQEALLVATGLAR